MQFTEAGFDTMAMARALTRARRLPCLRWLNAADAVNLGSDPTLDNLTNFEYLALVYPTSAFTSGGILGKGTAGGASRRTMELRTGQTATQGLFGLVDLATEDAWAEADVMLLDRWQWAGMQYSDATKVVRLFHAAHPLLPLAEPSYSGAMTGSGATGDNASLNQFLGCYGGGTSGGAGKRIAFAAIVNRVWTDAERHGFQRWVMGRGGAPPWGLVGLYFPGLHGALRVVDYSGRGNHGSVSGPLVGPGPLLSSGRRRLPIPLVDVQLLVADVAQALSAEAPALTQANILATSDALMALAAETPVLSQANVLALADALLALSAESPSLTQANVLAAQDALLALAAEAPALVQAHLLALADAVLALGVEAVVLTAGDLLAPADVAIALAAENPALVQAHVLGIVDAGLALAAESPALTQANALLVADGLLVLVLDDPVLFLPGVFIPARRRIVALAMPTVVAATARRIVALSDARVS